MLSHHTNTANSRQNHTTTTNGCCAEQRKINREMTDFNISEYLQLRFLFVNPQLFHELICYHAHAVVCTAAI